MSNELSITRRVVTRAKGDEADISTQQMAEAHVEQAHATADDGQRTGRLRQGITA